MAESDWRHLEFAVPIQQSVTETSNDFLIQGVAINATMTRNGTIFESKELQKAAPTLKNRPLLKNHDNDIDSVVGNVTENVRFNKNKSRVEFEARVVDKSAQEKIKAGLVNSVSIGAFLEDVEEVTDDDGELVGFKVKGIEFVELSLVAVPADPQAGFAMAISESYKKKNAVKQAGVLQGKWTSATGTISDASTTTSPSTPTPTKVEEGDNHMEPQEQSELEKIREENAKLELELETQRNEHLKKEQERLSKQDAEPEEEPEPEAEPKPDPVEDETEGEVADEDNDEDTEQRGDYTVGSSDLGGSSITVNVGARESLNRMKPRESAMQKAIASMR